MSEYELHPITKKSLLKGHPWVTRDAYSLRFPKHKKILNLRPYGFFIHDPQHPRVVARFWSKDSGDFGEQLEFKIEKALKKRLPLLERRDNIYLSFGEADSLPGLYVQKLGASLLFQYECFFWEHQLKNLVKFYEKLIVNYELNITKFWAQKRIPGEGKKHPLPLKKGQDSEWKLKEGEISFLVKFNLNHDIGWYTDMSSVREKLYPIFEKSSSVLNLFSYTGAFSLYAMKYGSETHSVDLSSKYMSWLEENLRINAFESGKHESHVTTCEKALEKFKGQNLKFDFIICDPPSSFTNKKKKQSVKQFYEANLLKILNLLKNRGCALIFINTHHLSAAQFKNFIKEKIKAFKAFSISDEFGLGLDCQPLAHFKEGNYLKGLLLRKKDNGT